MDGCMGLTMVFVGTPTPSRGVLDVSNDGLASGIDVDMLDNHSLF